MNDEVSCLSIRAVRWWMWLIITVTRVFMRPWGEDTSSWWSCYCTEELWYTYATRDREPSSTAHTTPAARCVCAQFSWLILHFYIHISEMCPSGMYNKERIKPGCARLVVWHTFYISDFWYKPFNVISSNLKDNFIFFSKNTEIQKLLQKACAETVESNLIKSHSAGPERIVGKKLIINTAVIHFQKYWLHACCVLYYMKCCCLLLKTIFVLLLIHSEMQRRQSPDGGGGKITDAKHRYPHEQPV